jgi:large subunit ribosomal protein L25
MKQLKLKVAVRQEIGRRHSKRLRAQGFVPAVIYGKSGSRSLTIEEQELRRLLRQMIGTAAIIEIHDDFNNKNICLIQEITRDAVTDYLTHVDLHEISANEKMRAMVPVHLIGEAYGAKNESGLVECLTHTLEVRCLPQYLPEAIEVNISELRVGQSLHVGNLVKMDGVEYMADKETVIVVCALPSVGEEASAAENESTVKTGGAESTSGKSTSTQATDASPKTASAKKK